jgi:hypothetical protein
MFNKVEIIVKNFFDVKSLAKKIIFIYSFDKKGEKTSKGFQGKVRGMLIR